MLRAAGLAMLLLSLLLTGCKGMFGRQGLPPDPLFANRKPVESNLKAGPATPIPFSEPTPAVNPYASTE